MKQTNKQKVLVLFATGGLVAAKFLFIGKQHRKSYNFVLYIDMMQINIALTVQSWWLRI